MCKIVMLVLSESDRGNYNINCLKTIDCKTTLYCVKSGHSQEQEASEETEGMEWEKIQGSGKVEEGESEFLSLWLLFRHFLTHRHAGVFLRFYIS